MAPCAPHDEPAADVPSHPPVFLPGGDPHGVEAPGVLAYFADRAAAEDAARALRAAGLGPARIEDRMPQPVDRASLGQNPYPRLDLEDRLGTGLPIDPRTHHTTLVAVAAAGEDDASALRILRARGSSV